MSMDTSYDLFDTFFNISLPSLTFSAGASLSDSLTITVPDNLPSGTYYIMGYMPTYDEYPHAADIHPANNTWANSITISGTACAADSYEQDDTLADATTLTPGDVLDLNFCDDSGDWFVFNATAGQSYTIQATVVGSVLDGIFIQLFDTGITEPFLSGTVDHVIEDVVDYDQAVLTWLAGASGTCYFRVAAFSGLRAAGPNTEYQLSFTLN